MKFTNKEFLKFLFVGGFNTVVTYVLYLIAIVFMSYQAAYILSYCFGLFLVSVLNVKFVYDQAVNFRNGLKTIFVYLLQFAIGFILTIAFVEYGGIDERVAPALSIIILIPFTFFANKFVLNKESYQSSP